MEYTVKALADLVGVTPRLCAGMIGLDCRPLRTTRLKMPRPSATGHLQDILFYRELGLDTARRTILDDDAFDRRGGTEPPGRAGGPSGRLDDLILTVQRTINDIKEERVTDGKFEAFKRGEANETAFGQEIREKYGDEEMDRANACVR